MSESKHDLDWTQIIETAQRDVKKLLQDRQNPPHCKLDGPIAKYIDHTQLKLDATESQIDSLCTEARKAGFATVCVRLNYVPRALSQLKGTKVGVACVIGFHEGTYGLDVKVREARAALDAGATELDVVLNREHLLSRNYAMVFEELHTLRAVHAPEERVVIKVILETSQLGEDDMIAACTLAGYAGWDFVKTSTGVLGRGASLEDVRVMDAVAEYLHQRGVGPNDGHGRTVKMKVKASGGVRSYEDAMRMIEVGATRIGTSSGMMIVQEATATPGEVQSKGEDKAGVNEKERSKNEY